MKRITVLSVVILLFVFLIIGQSDNAHSQGVPFEGCCQLFSGCVNLSQSACLENPNAFHFVADELCDTSTNRCPGLPLNYSKARSVPTLSEWGLIAMAGVLGIVGFMVIRRRRIASADI